MAFEICTSLRAWSDYWCSFGDDTIDFDIVNVIDDVIIAAEQKESIGPRTSSFMKTIDVVEMADMLLPEEEEETSS